MKHLSFFVALVLAVSLTGQTGPATTPQQREQLRAVAEKLKTCHCPCHAKSWMKDGQQISSSVKLNGHNYPVGPCDCSDECAAKDKCANPDHAEGLDKAQRDRVKCVCKVRRNLLKWLDAQPN